MRTAPRISESRQGMHAFGTLLMGIGVLLVVGGMISFFSIVGSPGSLIGESFPPKGFLFAAGGMVLLAIGRGMRTLGARGVAGSGLVLDPERAAEDLAPWAHTGGKLLRDAVDAGGLTTQDDGDAIEIVKVRCRECRALNAETARFCDQCGAGL